MRKLVLFIIRFPHVSEGYEKKQHHGHDENEKNSGWENIFSQPLIFSFSPDAKHPVGGILPPCPWWRAPVAHPTRKVTIFFCKEFLRVSWRGDDNPSSPAGQFPLHKGAFFLMFQRDFLVPAGKLFFG
ncbi:MAG: hypothetical protein IKJ51_03095 [Clostridia bacterium]|nr:hypothetical protein [Clostridia bacterium]